MALLAAICDMALAALVDMVGICPTPPAMEAALAAMPLERAAMNTGLVETKARAATSELRLLTRELPVTIPAELVAIPAELPATRAVLEAMAVVASETNIAIAADSVPVVAERLAKEVELTPMLIMLAAILS